MTAEIHNSLILLEASTGIEPVYTDLQSAASPLRQLACYGAGLAIAYPLTTRKGRAVLRWC